MGEAGRVPMLSLRRFIRGVGLSVTYHLPSGGDDVFVVQLAFALKEC